MDSTVLQDYRARFGTSKLIPTKGQSVRRRLNLVLPVISDKWRFGGIATALRFIERLSPAFDAARVIVTQESALQTVGTSQLERAEPVRLGPQPIEFLGHPEAVLPIAEHDLFIATQWSTALYVQYVLETQALLFRNPARRYVYFIQDYEPGFYAWSPIYHYAKQSYKGKKNAIAIFNSSSLADYFQQHAIIFPKHYVFEPTLLPELRRVRDELRHTRKERMIFVYARPDTPRNGFDVIIEALKIWALSFHCAHEWTVLSDGDPHPDIELAPGIVLRSRGKSPLNEYAQYLSRCWVGISLVLSPHPGYSALEIAEFGGWLITNKWENKDLSILAPNIIAVDELTPEAIAASLQRCCIQHDAEPRTLLPSESRIFRDSEDEFPFVSDLLRSWHQTDLSSPHQACDNNFP